MVRMVRNGSNGSVPRRSNLSTPLATVRLEVPGLGRQEDLGANHAFDGSGPHFTLGAEGLPRGPVLDAPARDLSLRSELEK